MDTGPATLDPHAFLRRGAEGEIETHSAWIVLRGAEALKIKRPVRYDYLDFTALETRRAVLQRELELNRREAPQIYRDVVPVTVQGGRLALDGDGAPVEWVLRMRRFPQEALLDRVAAAGGLDQGLAEALGRKVAAYHAGAPVIRTDGAALIAEILDEFGREMPPLARRLDLPDPAALLDRLRAALAPVAALLRARGAAGHVRRGHGDLHLRNIVLLEGAPVLFDALEFDERLGTCDVLYDLAFLVMDLVHRDLVPAANRVLSAYVEAETEGHSLPGLAALPLFLAVRATIRAMVAEERAAGPGDAAARAEAQGYLDLAGALLAPPRPALVGIGGLSGTGKTTVARAVAPEIGPPPGALVLRSDVARKTLAGVAPLTPLPPEAYDRAQSRRVYDKLISDADAVLAAGRGAVVDAVFAEAEDRDRLAGIAARHGAPFLGVWLEAPAATRVARVGGRRDDASDADAAVAAAQVAPAAAALAWVRVPADGPPGAVAARVRALIAQEVPHAPSDP